MVIDCDRIQSLSPYVVQTITLYSTQAKISIFVCLLRGQRLATNFVVVNNYNSILYIFIGCEF